MNELSLESVVYFACDDSFHNYSNNVTYGRSSTVWEYKTELYFSELILIVFHIYFHICHILDCFNSPIWVKEQHFHLISILYPSVPSSIKMRQTNPELYFNKGSPLSFSAGINPSNDGAAFVQSTRTQGGENPLTIGLGSNTGLGMWEICQ